MFQQHEIDGVISNMKLALDQKQGQVESDTIDEFLTGLGQMAAACELCKIKVIDELGEVKIFEALAGRLKLHGILILTMQFPDGDKYELVTRYNDQQEKIYSFCYKL